MYTQYRHFRFYYFKLRCDALEIENGNFADLVHEAEAQKVNIMNIQYIKYSTAKD